MLVLGTLVTGVACSGTADREAGWTVRDSAGIRIVENDHTLPLWQPGAEWRVSAEPIVRIGTVSADTTTQLYRVTHSRRLSDGRIAVVNSGSSQVRFYDASGRFAGALGGRGDGPGEFRSPWIVHQIAGDSLLVIDLYRHISIFDADGRFARRFLPERPEQQQLGEGFEPVDQFGDGSLLFRAHERWDRSRTGIGRSRIAMVRTRLDGSFAGSLGQFDDQTVDFAGPLYMWGPWAKEAAADTTMWYGPGDRFELREVTFDGRTIRLVRLDRPARPITEADVTRFKDAAIEQARGTPAEQTVNRRFAEMQHPETFPFHFDIKTDALGNLWVQDYQPWTDRVPRSWSVFDGEGRFLGDVTIPAAVTVHEFGDDYVLGHWTDDLDVEYVVLYRLEKRS
jgi:hypothetical protein